MKNTEKALAISFIASLSTAIINETLNAVFTSYLLVSILLCLFAIGINLVIKAKGLINLFTPIVVLLISFTFSFIPKAKQSLSVLSINGVTVASMSPLWVNFFAVLLLSFALLLGGLLLAEYKW